MWFKQLQAITPSIGYAIAICMLVNIMIATFLHRKSITGGLKGEDGKWQFIEWAQLIWTILFPGLVICDLLGVHASLNVWTSMDAVYLISVGGKVGSKYFEARKETLK